MWVFNGFSVYYQFAHWKSCSPLPFLVFATHLVAPEGYFLKILSSTDQQEYFHCFIMVFKGQTSSCIYLCSCSLCFMNLKSRPMFSSTQVFILLLTLRRHSLQHLLLLVIYLFLLFMVVLFYSQGALEKFYNQVCQTVPFIFSLPL